MGFVPLLKSCICPALRVGYGEESASAGFASDLVWWDFRDSDSLTLSSGSLDSAANKGSGGSNYDLVCNSGVKGTVTDGSHVSFNGSQNNYTAGGAGDFDFLHDGSGCHVFVVIKNKSTYNGINFLWGSNDLSGSSSAVGSRFFVDQRAGFDEYTYVLGTGSGTNTGSSAERALSEDAYVVLEYGLEVGNAKEVVVYEDNALLKSNAVVSLSSDSHAEPTKFFTSNDCEVQAVVITDRRLNEQERLAYHTRLANLYALPPINFVLQYGDSNAGGLGSSGSISAAYQGVIRNCLIWAHEGGNPANDLAMWPLEQVNSQVDLVTSSTGADLALMATQQLATGEKEYLIKAWEGGATLDVHFDPELTNGNNSTWEELVSRVNGAVGWANSIGRDYRFRYAFSILGHNDAYNEARSLRYGTNQAAFNTALRTLVGDDNMDIVLLMPSPEGIDNPDAAFTVVEFMANVRDSLITEVGGDSNVYIYQPVNSSPLDLTFNEASPSGLHYDMPVLETVGEEVAAGMNASSVPVVSTAPSIDTSNGTGVGDILTLDAGVWSNDLLEARGIQWKRDGAAISGANAWQYETQSADDNTSITCSFVPVNKAGAGAQVTTAAVAISDISRTSPLSDVVSGVVFDLDFTVAASYSGSGSAVVNLTGDTAYDHNLGTTSGSDTSDFTFNGTAGTSGAYVSSDGNDVMTLQTFAPAYIKDLHKGAESFCFIFAGRYADGYSGLFGTTIAGLDGVGAMVQTGNRVIVNQDGGAATSASLTVAPAADSDSIIMVGWDNDSEEWFAYVYDQAPEDSAIVADTFIASSTDPIGYRIGFYNPSGANMLNGGRIKAVGLLDVHPDAATRAAIVAHYELRHEINYNGS